MMKKVLSPGAAADLVPDGARIMIGGFMGVGTPRRIFDALVASGRRGLTLIANDTAMPGRGIGKLISAKAVRRLIVSHIGLNPETQKQMNDGTLEVELMPQGTLVECIRAGVIGLGARPPEGMEDPDLTDAGGGFVTAVPGAAAIDSAMSFGLIRGGHIDVWVLGGLQVDETGHLANWMIPGKMVPGMGGAMDLATGARRVIVAMQHVAKGVSKGVRKCDLPLTSSRPIDLLVTDMAVFEVRDTRLTLTEIAPGMTPEMVADATEARFETADHPGIRA